MKLGEFLIDLVVDAGEGTLTVGNLIKKFGELEAVSLGELGVLFSLADKFSSLTHAAGETAETLTLFTRMTGLSSTELQKYEGAAQQALVKSGAFKQSVIQMTEALAKLKTAQGDAGLSVLGERFGINMFGKNAFQILDEIRKSKRFHAQPADIQAQLLRDAGVTDMSMFNFFDLSDKKLKELMDHSAVMSDKFRHDLDEQSKATQTWLQISKQAGYGVVQAGSGAIAEDLKRMEKYRDVVSQIGTAFEKWHVPEKMSKLLILMQDSLFIGSSPGRRQILSDLGINIDAIDTRLKAKPVAVSESSAVSSSYSPEALKTLALAAPALHPVNVQNNFSVKVDKQGKTTVTDHGAEIDAANKQLQAGTR